MNTDIILSSTVTEYSFLNSVEEFVSLKQQEETSISTILPEILFITSFPPRECGIATYTKDLVDALNTQFENSFTCSICALESNTESPNYTSKPSLIINTDKRNDFAKAAFKINRNENIKLVVIQHEFGFFENNKASLKILDQVITAPIIFVFHTVLPNPNDEIKNQVQEMSEVASSIIVMTKNAATILMNEYAVPSFKIIVIPHGTHLVASLDRDKAKKEFKLENRKILSTFGLLGSSKSIQTTLEALPSIIKKHPDVLFLILGKTHPSVVKQEGEKYRESLEKKVSDLNIGDHVRFVNEYLPLPTLLEYLQLTDIYLFTSKDPNQAVSGTFSYAVSSGCPVISTPIPHAKEVLNNNNGIIIDFENSTQLAQAVILLLDNKKMRSEISLRSLEKMASTAWQNSAIAHARLFQKITDNQITLHYRTPEINLDHVQNMTTDFGMIQFSKISDPDIHSGYTLDDNARALITTCQHYELFESAVDLKNIKTYLHFIEFCMQPSGKFLNYVDDHKRFTVQNSKENLEDSTGRAIWALGYVVSMRELLPQALRVLANGLLQKAFPHLNKIHSTRAMAFTIKGLHFQNKKENMPLLKLLANRLVQMYKHESTTTWNWFEEYLTYGNSLLPEALLCAYISTENSEYETIARDSFGFLLSKIFIDGKIKVISNKGWLLKDKIDHSVIGGEQPIDVAYTIMTLAKFYFVFQNIEYQHKAKIAFNWFLGENHLHQIVYNPRTGGCYDGVEEFNINLNQGAESTLSYLLARITLTKINLFNEKLIHQGESLTFDQILKCKNLDLVS